MQLGHQSFKLLITGKSGSGKTTYFVDFVNGSSYDRFFIFDHEGELSIRFNQQPCYSPDDLVKAVNGNIPRIIYDPSTMYAGDWQSAFAFFSEWTFECCKTFGGRKLFCVDELQKMVSTTEIPWELSLLLETGRRRGIDAVMVSQQPNIIHNRIRNLINEAVTFQHVDPSAIEFHEELGFDPDEIRSLKRLHFIAKNLDTQAERRGAVVPVKK
jgi:hypothetical protein